MAVEAEVAGLYLIMEYLREDGVRIAHDPYAPGMAEKYGLPGGTDQ